MSAWRPGASSTRLAGFAVLGLGSCLMLANLGDRLLWQDEAQTALLARSVLEHGIPNGFDGGNSFSQEQGAEVDSAGRWRWHGWLPFYLLAAFFAGFGESTGVARLPFALFGIATLAATGALGRALWSDRRAAYYAMLVLATSVPFLLLARQARWYTPAAFFTVLALWGYLRLLRRRPWAGPLLALALVGLFHSHYVYVLPVGAALALHAALWQRARLTAVLAWGAAALPFCLPFGLWLAGIGYREAFGSAVLEPAAAAQRLASYAALLSTYAFPPWLLAIPAAALVLRGPGMPRADAQAWGLLALVVAFTGMLLAWVSPAAFFRYLAPLVPLAALAVGALCARASSARRWLGGLVVLILAVRGSGVPFLHELRHDVSGPLEALVRVLDERAGPDDVVAITYGDMPLKFYTDLRVVGGLTGEDLTPALSADWVVIRHHVISPAMDGEVRRFLERNLDWQRYRRIELDVPDLAFENREDPAAHRFRSETRGPRLVIYRRVASGSEGDSRR